MNATHLIFFFFDGASESTGVTQPIGMVAGMVFVPGVQAGEAFVPGAQEGQIFVPGMQQGKLTNGRN